MTLCDSFYLVLYCADFSVKIEKKKKKWIESRSGSGDYLVPNVTVCVCVFAAVKVKNIRRGVKEVQKFINKGEKG